MAECGKNIKNQFDREMPEKIAFNFYVIYWTENKY